MKKFSVIIEKTLNKDVKSKCKRLSQKSLLELNNMYFIFWLCSKNYFMNNINWILKKSNFILGDKVFYNLVNFTLGRQFTAGQDFQNVQKVINDYSRSNLLVAVNYMAEFQENMNNTQFDSITEKYIESMNLKTIGNEKLFTAIKFSALIDYKILMKLNNNQELFDKIFSESTVNNEFFAKKDLLTKNLRKNFNYLTESETIELLNLCELNINNKIDNSLSLMEWRLGINCFNINKKIKTNSLYKKILNYSSIELEEINLFETRINKIVNKAIETNSYILTDAEQSFLQIAIANLTEQLMLKYNTNNQLIFFQTYQNYLIQSNFEIRYELFKKQLLKNYSIAIKLVRGAYMLQEREIEERSNKSIIHINKEQTDLNYNKNCHLVLEALDSNSMMIVATHNEYSVKSVLDKINKNHQKYINNVYFATLQGLNDNLAFDTLEETSRVMKYLPYGEKEIMLPYLIRRGIESREIIQKDKSILKQIENELRSRIV